MSGGGRCNFTNYSIDPDNFISNNPHFCKSPLSRYTQWDFLALITRYQIPYHERDHGQFTLKPEDKDKFSPLSGIAVPCIIRNKQRSFSGNVLFTHRALSGPAVLQI
jgi:predicted flavoprotein YhiN